jgi:hypothetical protein
VLRRIDDRTRRAALNGLAFAQHNQFVGSRPGNAASLTLAAARRL